MRFVVIFVLVLGISGLGLWYLAGTLASAPGGLQAAGPVDSTGTATAATAGQAAVAAPETAAAAAGADAAADGPVRFTIREGETTGEIARELVQAGLTQNAFLFRFWVQWRGAEGKLQAGDYDLRRGMSMDELIEALQQAKAKDEPVRFLEGWRMEEMAEELERRQLGIDAKRFLELARKGEFVYDFLESRPAGASLDGYLFPDTYRVISGKTTAEELIHAMLKRFGEALPPELREEARRNGYTVHQVVTLASVVEREAALPQERARIAGVFHNRVRTGMHLNADPTLQYALGYQPGSSTWWKKPLLNADKAVDSPYNTYTHTGLPPGPISNPGRDSLLAAARPEKHDYFYFVANDTKADGSHVFAKTLEEHERNRRQYQRSS